jgi:hypothetical protein
MPSLSSDALYLAGFVLAHAAWSVSDLPEDELLCPLAIIERSGGRHLVRFEAPSQTEAITAARSALQLAIVRRETAAFAREGTWRPLETGQASDDVLTVEFYDETMDRPAMILQRFRRLSPTAQFRLVGDPALVLDGNLVEGGASRHAIEDLLLGVRSHPAVRDLWDSWQV